eukprot:2646886-Pleurochrysis_carterae.AAC.1
MVDASKQSEPLEDKIRLLLNQTDHPLPAIFVRIGIGHRIEHHHTTPNRKRGKGLPANFNPSGPNLGGDSDLSDWLAPGRLARRTRTSWYSILEGHRLGRTYIDASSLPSPAQCGPGLQEERYIGSNCTFWYGSGRCPLPLPPSKSLVRMGGRTKGPGPSGTDLRVSEPRDEQVTGAG